MTMTTPTTPENHHQDSTTRLRSHGQLLVGWIAGGTTTTTASSSSREPTAQPTPASDCSQGESQVLRAYDDVGEHQDPRTTRGTRGNGGEGMASTKEQHTTRPQPHEQLLMGWIVGGTTTTTASRAAGNLPPNPRLRATARRVDRRCHETTTTLESTKTQG
jgi:hypothetical protein